MANLKIVWCRVMHRDVAYGGGDVYWCRRCSCRFPVPWAPVSHRDGESGTIAMPVNATELPQQPVGTAAG